MKASESFDKITEVFENTLKREPTIKDVQTLAILASDYEGFYEAAKDHVESAESCEGCPKDGKCILQDIVNDKFAFLADVEHPTEDEIGDAVEKSLQQEDKPDDLRDKLKDISKNIED